MQLIKYKKTYCMGAGSKKNMQLVEITKNICKNNINEEKK